MNGRIFKVEDGAIEEVTSDPLLSWVDQSFPFGSNGMAYDKSNGLLLIANTGAASLVRLQLSTNEVTSIPIMGDIGNVDDVLLDSNNRLFLISEQLFTFLQMKEMSGEVLLFGEPSTLIDLNLEKVLLVGHLESMRVRFTSHTSGSTIFSVLALTIILRLLERWR